jgi:DNA-binding transcriptional MerR regulator
MEDQKKKEIDRADRIGFTIEECHELLAGLYESLVDREFSDASQKCIAIIAEIKIIIKSIDKDDF